MTHTLATLEVSRATFAEVLGRLTDAGRAQAYDIRMDWIDMTGIALVGSKAPLARPVGDGPLSSHISIDDRLEVMTAFGVMVSAEFIRGWSTPTPEGQWFRIIKVDDGGATVNVRSDLVEPERTSGWSAKDMHDTLQKLGSALELPAGSDLKRDLLPTLYRRLAAAPDSEGGQL